MIFDNFHFSLAVPPLSLCCIYSCRAPHLVAPRRAAPLVVPLPVASMPIREITSVRSEAHIFTRFRQLLLLFPRFVCAGLLQYCTLDSTAHWIQGSSCVHCAVQYSTRKLTAANLLCSLVYSLQSTILSMSTQYTTRTVPTHSVLSEQYFLVFPGAPED